MINLGLLGSYFKVTQTDFGLSPTTPTQIAKQSGSRYYLLLSNQTANDAIVQFGQFTVGATGVRIKFATNAFDFAFDYVGGLVQEAMFAICDPPGTTLNVTEVLYLPPVVGD